MIVKIPLPNLADENTTRLTSGISIGATTLSVENGNGYANGQYIVLGTPGKEKTEAVLVSAATDITITVGATKYEHAAGESVTHTLFDKYSVEYRIAAAGAWTVAASMPATFRWDQLVNVYRPSGGADYYSFQIRLYSTEKGGYSNYSDEIITSGLGRGTVKKMTDRVLETLNDVDANTYSRQQILQLLREAQEIILSEYPKWRFLLTSDTDTTVADQTDYDLPDDYDRLDHVTYNFSDGTSDRTYRLTKKSLREYESLQQDNNLSASDSITYYTINADNTSVVIPKPDDGAMTLTFYYYKIPADLDSDGDETDIPIPAALIYYVLAEIENQRGNDERATRYERRFKRLMKNLKAKYMPAVDGLQGFKYIGNNGWSRTEGVGLLTQEDIENYWTNR